MEDCIRWHGAPGKHGYGVRYFPREGGGVRREYAHRDAYAQAHGPIPDGMHVHHKCGNRMCVNPAHMELLSNADHHGKLGGHGKLLREDAQEIRRRLAAGERGKELAAEYGVTTGMVTLIKQHKRWAEVAA